MRARSGGRGRRTAWGRRATLLGATALAAVLLSSTLAAPAQAGSVKRVDYRAFDDEDPRTFFNSGGLQLEGTCQLIGDQEYLTVVAKNSVADTAIRINRHGENSTSHLEEDDELGVGDELTVIDFGDEEGTGFTGQITYARPDGKVLTMDWLAQVNRPWGGRRHCAFMGTARVLDSSSADRIRFKANDGTPFTKIFDRGGLELRAKCDSGGDLEVFYRSEVGGAVIHGNGHGEGDGQVRMILDDNVVAGLDGEDGLIDHTSGLPLSDSSAGQFVYANPNGSVVTLDWMAEDVNETGETPEGALGNDCAFMGTARVRASGESKFVNYRKPTPSPLATFFNQGGLKLQGACTGSPSNSDMVRNWGTSSDHGLVQGNVHTDTDFDENYGEAPNLRSSSSPVEFFGTTGSAGFDSASADMASGQLVYSTVGGTIVTVDYLTVQSYVDLLGGTKDCIFTGSAEVAAP